MHEKGLMEVLTAVIMNHLDFSPLKRRELGASVCASHQQTFNQVVEKRPE